MADGARDQRERLRSLVEYCLPILRRTSREPVAYLRDVSLNAYAGRSRPVDLCIMRDSERRHVVQVVLPVITRAEWESIAADPHGMEPWLGKAQYVSVAIPGYSVKMDDSEVPGDWGLSQDDSRGSGFLFDRKRPPLLNAPTPDLDLALRDPDGRKVRWQDAFE